MATGTIPIPITDAVLTAHSVAEPSPGEVAWTSGATFALGDKCILGAPSHAVTITQAAPGVVSWTGHGLPNDTPIILTTTGTLPAGLTAGVILYIVNRATDTFQLSEAVGGVPITTASAGAGTHTATASIHRIYESLIAGNIGNPPAIDDGTKWFDRGPTNLWSMLDLYRPSITWGASPMTFTLTPGQVIRSLFFGSLVATQVDVVQKRAGVTIKTWSRELLTRTVVNFTDYWYKPFTVQQSVQILDTLLYGDSTFEITITRDSGPVGLGEIVQGNPVVLGKTQYGAQRKNRNYTKFDRNTDGTPQAPIRQRNVPSSVQTLTFPKDYTTALLQFGEDANGRVVVVSGLDDDAHPYFEPTLILGLITTFDIDLSHPNDGVLSLGAEEI
jgi:hypothetical protein